MGRWARAPTPPTAFTGDTLFCGGYGALFESSADELHDSFAKLKARLRGDCFLYPGHEYTEMLLRMVVRREPFNLAARKALKQAELRARKLPTVPTTLEQELTYNFTRAEDMRLGGCGPAYLCVEYLS